MEEEKKKELEKENGKKYLKITLGYQERKIRELTKGACYQLDFYLSIAIQRQSNTIKVNDSFVKDERGFSNEKISSLPIGTKRAHRILIYSRVFGELDAPCDPSCLTQFNHVPRRI